MKKAVGIEESELAKELENGESRSLCLLEGLEFGHLALETHLHILGTKHSTWAAFLFFLVLFLEMGTWAVILLAFFCL